MTNPARYGCHNRKPYPQAYSNGARWIQIFGKTDCQFTLSSLGQADKGCMGCVWKKESTKGAV